jgi:hypothetical protein
MGSDIPERTNNIQMMSGAVRIWGLTGWQLLIGAALIKN